MEIIYKAFDGKEFNNEDECENYEYLSKHKNLEKIDFYDKNLNLLKFNFSDEFYSKTEIVIIHNEKELKDLQDYAEETGYENFYDIKNVGVSIWDGESYVLVDYKDFLKSLTILCKEIEA